MATRVISAILTANVAPYVTAMRAAAVATGAPSAAAVQGARMTQTAMSAAGAAMVGIGVAAGAAGLIAVRAFANFDAAMSAVQAATGDSGAALDKLKEAALDAGASTVFSATEAAGAIEALSKAGVSSAEILGGALAGSLDLAAAGGIDVAQAAEIAATAMTQFGLKGGDVVHVADLLAAGAGKAQGEVTDMAMALQQSGLVAAQFGLSIEETTGALALFASNGLIGTNAGTSFKTMLLSLAAPSGVAADEMERLGISAYDAQGNFIGLENLAGVLQDRLGGLTAEQRQAALAIIFGRDAIQSASILYESGAVGVAEWAAKVNDAGFAAETAAIKLDNLKGDLEAFAGALETALIRTGDSGNGPLRLLVQTLTAVVSAYSNLPGPIQSAVLATFALTAATLALGGAYLFAYARVAALVPQITLLAATFPRAATGAVALGTALRGLAAAGAALVAISFADSWMDKLDGLGTDAASAARGLAAFGQTGKVTGAAVGLLGEDLGKLQHALETLRDVGIAEKIFGFGTAFTPFSGALEDSTERVEELDAALAALAQGGSGDEAAAAFQRIAEQAEAADVPMSRLKELFPEYSAFVDAASVSTQAAAAELGIMGDAAALSAEEMDAYAEGVKELADVFASFIDPMNAYTALLGTATEEEKAMAQATADATASSADSWEDYVGSVAVSVSEYLAELERQVAAQAAWESNMLALAGRVSQGTLDELARMGPEGAPLVANLVNASDAELARMDELFAARTNEATGAAAARLRAAAPVLAAVAGAAGSATAAQLGRELAAGTITVQQIMDRYGIIIKNGVPTVVATEIRLDGVNVAMIQAQSHARTLAAIPRSVTTTLTTHRVSTGIRGGIADGGVFESFAAGGVTEYHHAQIAPAGAMRLWAEPETGGEAYIPLAAAKRPRSEAILEDVASRFGYVIVREDRFRTAKPYATGGVNAPTTPARGGIVQNFNLDTAAAARTAKEYAREVATEMRRDAALHGRTIRT